MDGPRKILWDFSQSNNRNHIQEWARSENLSSRDRAALDHRFYMLQQMDYDLAVGTKVLNGPLRSSKGIYKLKAFGDRALRPMLCRGPISALTEYTILEGAIEVEMGKLQPKDAEKRAGKNRIEVENAPTTRRILHQPFLAPRSPA